MKSDFDKAMELHAWLAEQVAEASRLAHGAGSRNAQQRAAARERVAQADAFRRARAKLEELWPEE